MPEAKGYSLTYGTYVARAPADDAIGRTEERYGSGPGGDLRVPFGIRRERYFLQQEGRGGSPCR